MLPPNEGLTKRLDGALGQYRLPADLRAEIENAAVPQIALTHTDDSVTHLTLGDIHERARKLDPSVPKEFKSAMESPGIDAMEYLLRAHASGGETRLGASRLGGKPDLPPGVDWPKHKGKHLPFIAQIALAALPHWPGNPLPRSGWLWAFAGGDFPLTCAMIYWDGDAAALRQWPVPRASEMLLSDHIGEPKYGEVPLGPPEVVINLPHYYSEWWNAHVEEQFADDLLELSRTIERPLNNQDGADAHMLGYLACEESPMALAVEAGGKKGKDWMPLLHVRSVGTMMWSDMGQLVFMIREADLAARDFSDTYAVILST